MGNVNDSDAQIERKPKATQLLYAAEHGKLDFLEELLKDTTSINIDTVNSSAFTPLFLASKEGHGDCVKVLLKAGAKVDGVGEKNTALTPIWVATYSGHEECVDYLLRAGANLNSKYPITPLFIASREGQSGCLELLINAGADLEVRNSSLQTPLIVACKGLHRRCVELLVSAGSDVNATDKHSHTPLYYACSLAPDGHQIIKILLSAGADVNQICDKIASPTILHVCAIRGKFESIKLLLLFGPEIKKDSNGHTPKELADLDHIKQLLEFYEGECNLIYTLRAITNHANLEASSQGIISAPNNFSYKMVHISTSLLKRELTFLYTTLGYVPSLKQMCCWNIRKCLGPKRLFKIPELPIPRILQKYSREQELWDSSNWILELPIYF